MRRAAFGVAALAYLSVSAALASTDVQGTIKALDWTTRQLSLIDGSNFAVQRGINMGKFKAGDKVTLRFESMRGVNTVIKMTKADRIDETHTRKSGPFGLGRIL